MPRPRDRAPTELGGGARGRGSAARPPACPGARAALARDTCLPGARACPWSRRRELWRMSTGRCSGVHRSPQPPRHPEGGGPETRAFLQPNGAPPSPPHPPRDRDHGPCTISYAPYAPEPRLACAGPVVWSRAQRLWLRAAHHGRVAPSVSSHHACGERGHGVLLSSLTTSAAT